jgi:hypothetical protein
MGMEYAKMIFVYVIQGLEELIVMLYKSISDVLKTVIRKVDVKMVYVFACKVIRKMIIGTKII